MSFNVLEKTLQECHFALYVYPVVEARLDIWINENVAFVATFPTATHRQGPSLSQVFVKKRNNFSVLYQFEETRMDVWQNEKYCRKFSQLLRILTNFRECFLKRNCLFLTVLQWSNTQDEIRKDYFSFLGHRYRRSKEVHIWLRPSLFRHWSTRGEPRAILWQKPSW